MTLRAENIPTLLWQSGSFDLLELLPKNRKLPFFGFSLGSLVELDRSLAELVVAIGIFNY
jgi:hypothetical protein